MAVTVLSSILVAACMHGRTATSGLMGSTNGMSKVPGHKGCFSESANNTIGAVTGSAETPTFHVTPVTTLGPGCSSI